MITTEQMVTLAAEYGLDAGGIEYSGTVYVTPAQFLAITGIEPDFRRPDGRTEQDGCGRPTSVVYRHGPDGSLGREMDLVSYRGIYPARGPLGGTHVHPQSPVEFVVTRRDK